MLQNKPLTRNRLVQLLLRLDDDGHMRVSGGAYKLQIHAEEESSDVSIRLADAMKQDVSQFGTLPDEGLRR